MKRQKIQRELMKLEQENLEKREEIVIKKDEAPTKTRATAIPKVSDWPLHLLAKKAGKYLLKHLCPQNSSLPWLKSVGGRLVLNFNLICHPRSSGITRAVEH